METSEQTAFALILHAGNARTLAYEAFDRAAEGDLAGAREKMRAAQAEIGVSHRDQVEMIQREARGEQVAPTLLLIHAQDHLMTAMTELNLIERLIRVLVTRQ